eukprot:CAMPEP_0184680608 /NCGR_PEP_ID=MMETSP0312-20130426/3500_1 /TAXON_ID=31354 /ORGANISM="Compsopogon coeruleus, Strain SAG 36.94" /LENGTH=343 /DNA_ID=CAMNT_0027130843 /DNA_START=266 /DNA_END=1297 /DNA_ORIENTATION=+
MSGKVRVGIIGCGRIGQVHCRALEGNPSAEVVIAADYFVKAAQACAKKFGIPRAVQDWKEVVQASNVDAVVICSPSDTHCQIIIAAAQAGKHIFCEKPIDYKLERIDVALEAVRKSGVKLQLGFQRRFDANFQRVRHAVQSGEIGSPYMLNIISRDPAPPPLAYLKQSGGLFFDMMIHDFDMARFILGSEAVEIHASANSFDQSIADIGDVTTAVVTIHFQNGALGTIQCCRKAAYGYDQRVEVLGSGGAVDIGNNFPNTATVSTDQAVRRDLPLNFFMDRYVEAYANEMIAFVDMVKNGTEPVVTGIDGRVPVVMAYAAMKSLKEKRSVRLAEVDIVPNARL